MSTSPIVVGRFGKTFGVLGWIKVISFTSPQENILKLQPWLIKKDGQWQELELEGFKSNVKGVTVKISGYDSPETVKSFTNVEIGVLSEQLPELPQGEYYWSDLVGLAVTNKEGIDLGVVKELMSTGSNDVLIVVGGRKRLIPYTSDVVIDVDLSNKIIHVDWDADF